MEHPYFTPDGHVALLSHPITFKFAARYPDTPFRNISITVVQSDSDVPQAVLLFQAYDRTELIRHDAFEVVFHDLSVPYSPPFSHPILNPLPPIYPSTYDFAQSPQLWLTVDIAPLKGKPDAYRLMQMPSIPEQRRNGLVTDGIGLIWKQTICLQVVGLKRIHRNVVIFIAREVMTTYIIEIWCEPHMARVPENIFPHPMFKGRHYLDIVNFPEGSRSST
jgi:hypothetical protein